MKNRPISAIPSSFVLMMALVYALLAAIFPELDNVSGEGEKFVVDNESTTMTYSPQVKEVETDCKSPCSKSAEICIAMCA
jgi:hypothetical protein